MIAQKTPQKRTAILNAVTLILTQDGNSAESQADLKTEGTGPRMFNPAPDTPALIKHTGTKKGLWDCMENYTLCFRASSDILENIFYSVY